MTNNETPKPWYKSKTIWAGIVTVLVTVYDNALVPALINTFSITLPLIPSWLYGLLGTLGIYGRFDAKKSIGK